jgi:hypothetical protein
MPERDPKTNATRFVFKLFIPPERDVDEFGNPTEMEEIWLTPPLSQPYMLDAITTFNFVGRDVGHGDDYVREIDYEAVSAAVRQRREQNAAQRVQKRAFHYNRGLLSSIEAIQDEKQRSSALLELARIERIMELRERFRKEILPYYGKLLPEPAAQNDYDLASIFWMMLTDEAKAVQQALRDKIRALRELGLVSSDNPSNGPEHLL